jgi:hypothetical protein
VLCVVISKSTATEYMLRIYPVVVLATWSCIPLLASRAMSTQAGSSKVIRFLRHGQAMHNINAERMRDTGCSHEVFLQAMKDDDHFDSPLTDLGRQQVFFYNLRV